jgi:hypothetical protein
VPARARAPGHVAHPVIMVSAMDAPTDRADRGSRPAPWSTSRRTTSGRCPCCSQRGDPDARDRTRCGGTACSSAR